MNYFFPVAVTGEDNEINVGHIVLFAAPLFAYVEGAGKGE
jgi:hypothetical protein